MGAPLPRPISIARPAPRPNYQQFQSVYTNTTERLADYFAGADGDSTQLSAQEAQLAAKYLQGKANQLSFSSYSDDAKLANVYQQYATVFKNLTLALKQPDRRIDTTMMGGNFPGSDGQLDLGSGPNRLGSELRALARQTGTVNVLSYQDILSAKLYDTSAV